jgi:hypothetical protein
MGNCYSLQNENFSVLNIDIYSNPVSTEVPITNLDSKRIKELPEMKYNNALPSYFKPGVNKDIEREFLIHSFYMIKENVKKGDYRHESAIYNNLKFRGSATQKYIPVTMGCMCRSDCVKRVNIIGIFLPHPLTIIQSNDEICRIIYEEGYQDNPNNGLFVKGMIVSPDCVTI